MRRLLVQNIPGGRSIHRATRNLGDFMESKIMGSIPVDFDLFFLPHSCHVDQFTFHISLPNLKSTIFIHLSMYIVIKFTSEWVKHLHILTLTMKFLCFAYPRLIMKVGKIRIYRDNSRRIEEPLATRSLVIRWQHFINWNVSAETYANWRKQSLCFLTSLCYGSVSMPWATKGVSGNPFAVSCQ